MEDYRLVLRQETVKADGDGSPDRRYDASGRNGIYPGTPGSRMLGRFAIVCMVRHVGLKGLRTSNHIYVQLFASRSLQITDRSGLLASNRISYHLSPSRVLRVLHSNLLER